jgi:hypothetical protein
MASIGMDKNIIKKACEALVKKVGEEVREYDKLVSEMDTTGFKNVYISETYEYRKVMFGLKQMMKAQSILILCEIANDHILIDDEEYNLLYTYLNK